MTERGDFRTTLLIFLGFGAATVLLDVVPSPWPAVLLLPFSALLFVVCAGWGRGPTSTRKVSSYPLRGIRPWLGWVLAFNAASIAVNIGAVIIVYVLTSDTMRGPAPRFAGKDPLTLIVSGVLWAPLVEEFLFRGWMLHRLLGRLGRWPAIVVTAIVFGLVHLDPIGFPGRVLLGITLAYAVLVTGSLWASILGHALNNGILVVLLLWARTESAHLPGPRTLIIVAGTVFLAGLCAWGALLRAGARSLQPAPPG